ncbi:MAG: ATP synthase F0 subunit C [Planctomycetes bacterium]|nr:ATP synthase F0 subunit C [Planctomycetota bacterium]
MTVNEFIHLARLVGAASGIGLGAVGAGIGLGYAAREAARGMARQPAVSGNLFRSMLLGQAITETPSIFALVMSVLLIFAISSQENIIQAAALMGAGLAIGLGALGSGFGSGYVAGEACRSIAVNPRASNRSMVTMLVGQALSQTTVIYALVIALILCFKDFDYGGDQSVTAVLPMMARLLGAGISVGAGAIGPGLGISLAGGAGAATAGRFPEQSALITRTMLIGAAVSETTSIYALVVSLLLVFLPS